MNEETKAPTAVELAKQRLREMQEGLDPRSPVPENSAPKEIKPVDAKPKKKKFSQKLKEAMFSEDIGNGSVGEHIFFKILIPSTKRVLSDMANTAINMALGLDPKTRTISTSHAANASLYRDRNYSRSDGSGGYTRRREAVSDFEWDEETAADIYNQCIDILDRYPSLSLGEVYAIMNMPEKIQSTDKNWGWTNPRSIDLVCVDFNNKIYRVEFPPARPI